MFHLGGTIFLIETGLNLPHSPILQILDKTQTGVFRISGFLVNPL